MYVDDKLFKEALQTQRVHVLAQAYRWVRDAATGDDAGEMVVQCLTTMGDPPTLLDAVLKEAATWDAVVTLED